jgi:hypothetical protein
MVGKADGAELGGCDGMAEEGESWYPDAAIPVHSVNAKKSAPWEIRNIIQRGRGRWPALASGKVKRKPAQVPRYLYHRSTGNKVKGSEQTNAKID